MTEWGVTPEYIVHNWTDEEFALMIEKLNERKQCEIDAIQGTHAHAPTVNDQELFRRMGKSVKYRGTK